jgi:hypothetical protein
MVHQRCSVAVQKKRPARLGGQPSRSCDTRHGVERDAPASIGTPAPRDLREHPQCHRPGCVEARKIGKRADHVHRNRQP